MLLAGCAPLAEPLTTPNLQSSSPEAPALHVGQTVDSDVVDELQPPLYGYPMPDGSYVVVDRNEPLPVEVQDDLDRQVTAYAEAITPQSYIDSGEAQIRAISGAASLNTGKRIVMIARIEGVRTASGSEATQTWYWAWGAGNINGDAGFDTVETALDAANAWVAKQDEPGLWAVIAPHL